MFAFGSVGSNASAMWRKRAVRDAFFVVVSRLP